MPNEIKIQSSQFFILRKKAYRIQLLLLLWSFVLTKCFVLEFLIERYSVPVNSALYIWSLSVFMALAASFVFFRVERESYQLERNLPTTVLIWGICFLATSILTALSLSLELIPSHRLQATIALLVGFSYSAHGIMDRRKSLCVIGFGWWLGASILFRITDSRALVVFAALLLILVTLPASVNALQIRKALKSAEAQT